MSQDPRRRKNRNQTRHQKGDLAATAAQNLWDRCLPLSRMSGGKDVQDSAAASSSMQQPLAVEITPMNNESTNRPPSCEKDILFRHGSLLPKTTKPRPPRPSVDLFLKILTPPTNPYRYKWATKNPDSPTSR